MKLPKIKKHYVLYMAGGAALIVAYGLYKSGAPATAPVVATPPPAAPAPSPTASIPTSLSGVTSMLGADGSVSGGGTASVCATPTCAPSAWSQIFCGTA